MDKQTADWDMVSGKLFLDYMEQIYMFIANAEPTPGVVMMKTLSSMIVPQMLYFLNESPYFH